MATKENNSKQEITVNEIAVTEKDQIAESQIERSTTEINKKRSPWPFLGLAMLAIAGGVVWKAVTVSQSPSSPIGHNLSLESSCQEGLGASRKKEVRRVFLSRGERSNN